MLPTPVSATSQPKPQKVQFIGILMLISGTVNISIGIGFVIGMAFSIVLCCCVPFGALPLALGIYEVINGIRLIGSGQEPVARQTLQTIAIFELLSIAASNVVSFAIGIINLVLLSDSEVVGYFQK